MFTSIKRAIFIGKFSASFARAYSYRDDISKVHLRLQEAGWPANEFVDLFIASKTDEHRFPEFIECMYAAYFHNDGYSIEYLCSWAKEGNVIKADNIRLCSWLEKFES